MEDININKAFGDSVFVIKGTSETTENKLKEPKADLFVCY